jgi:hypothetical protein
MMATNLQFIQYLTNCFDLVQVLKRHPETIRIVGSAFFYLATGVQPFHSPPSGWHRWDLIVQVQDTNTLTLIWYLTNN